MNKFAVFDIDGTLIRWQLYHVIVDRLAQSGQLSSEAAAQLKKARMKWKNREHHESFADYEQVLIDIFESSLKNINPKVFDSLVSNVIDQYQKQVYTYTRDLITELKQRGYVILAISGSHHELVEEIARAYGFDDWVGTTYERKDGSYSGKSFIASHHKAQVLQDLIRKHSLTHDGSYAVGDSRSDAPMLELVENPIAFNPDHNLISIARNNHWDIVIERKNMVYQLEWNNGRYVLAQTGE